MGKVKGKKLWRKAIDTQELVDAIEDSTLQQRQGPAVESIPDDQLFFIDETQDAGIVAAVSRGAPLTKKRKRDPKPLRCQLILNAAHKAKPINAAASKKSRLKGPVSKPAVKTLAYGKSIIKEEGDSYTKLDLWGHRIAPDPAERPAGRKMIQGVEVDIPGCSFNPEMEQHQDAIAEAVAAEMAKLYAKDHAPTSNKQFNHLPEPDELTALLGETAYDDETADSEADGEYADLAKKKAKSIDSVSAATVSEKKTQKDRNKALRRRQAEEEISAKQKLKKQRRDLDRVSDFNEEIQQQEILQQARAIRKAVTKAEKAMLEPPKLGKHKFQPANIQVLLTEEVDGSLRRLKGVPILAKDRFKALQKQGLIEPRVRIEQMTRRKRVEYQTGDRSDRIKAGHDETAKLVKSRDRAQAQRKKAAKPL